MTGCFLDSRASASTILPNSLRSSMSASRCFAEMARREWRAEVEGCVVGEGEGGVSPYLRDISWIARSMSSIWVGGVEGVSFGVEGVGVSDFDLFAFFFFFLDFLVDGEGVDS